MIKKILIVLGIIATILVLAFVYLNYRNRTLSPPGKEIFKRSGFSFEVDYSRPSVKGRLIFGAAADGALQPFGSYWRLGANEATEISFNKNILFNGEFLEAGRYRVYAIPGASTFVIGVNSEVGKWGAMEPDYSKDLFKTEVEVNYLNEPIEKFTIRIVQNPQGTADLFFEWSDVQLLVPIQLAE